MEEENDCYVYVYTLLDDGTPIYIGAGHGNRAWNHFSLCYNANLPSYKSHFYQKLRKLLSEDITPIVHLLVEDVTRYEAFEIWERFFIAAVGRRDLKTGPLCNHTDGGEGVKGASPEKLAKAGRSRKLRPPMRGKRYKNIIKTASGHRSQVVLPPLWPDTKGAVKYLGHSKIEEEAALRSDHGIDTYLDGDGPKNTDKIPDDFRPSWADTRPQRDNIDHSQNMLEIVDLLEAAIRTDIEKQVFAPDNWGLTVAAVARKLGKDHSWIAEVRRRVHERYTRLESA